MPPTSDRVAEILKSRVFAQFLGLREDETFEAKGAKPYDFGTEAGRYELAKDTSALANAEGGVLIVGLATQQSPNAATDEVTALELFPEADFPVSRVCGIIREYVYPEPKGLNVYWAEYEGESGLGVGVISIPGQNADAKPFLVLRVTSSTAVMKAVVFGYARRVGEHAEPIEGKTLQRIMRNGMNTTARRLQELSDKVALLLDAQGGDAGAEREAHSRSLIDAKFADIFGA